MCDDPVRNYKHAARAGQPSVPGLSRRTFLNAAGTAAAAAALLQRFPRLPLRSPARAVTAGGAAAYSMAMHVHSSFSEQNASMASQLHQAATNSLDVIWWTDHDHRMDGLGYRKSVHFTSLTDEPGGPGQGGPWIWVPRRSGPLGSSSGGGIVQDPCSPNDPVTGGSLHLHAQSDTTMPAKFGYYANCQPAQWNYRDNLTGQSLTIDVLLTGGWTAGYLELLIVSSYHDAASGRPAGDYTLSYRFVPPSAAASRAANGIDGVITVPVTPAGAGRWATVTVTPSDDIAALWPDLDHRDFALWELSLSAVSEGDQVEGYLDYLRFNRALSGEACLRQQEDMASVLSRRFGSVTQQQGLEVSWLEPHLNWFGGAVTIPDYGSGLTKRAWSEYLAATLVPHIHAAGGLVSYNHPYGSRDLPALPAAQQDALLRTVAGQLLAANALGADLLEVGYPLRQGVDLAHHVALWDIMSRNGLFLTGNGTNDDHEGEHWLGSRNNWFTTAWSASSSQKDLLAALAAGRAWCGSLSGYRGALDLVVDGSCPMGSVSVSSARSRRLAITATRLPANGSLQVLQGSVDYSGTYDLAANTRIVASYPATQLVKGQVIRAVDTSKDSFIRSQVLDAAGHLVGLSNPVWLLRHQPPGGIPLPRQA